MALGLFAPSFAQAACFVNGSEVPCVEFPWWIFIVFFLVLIAAFVFWITMLVHAAKNPIPNKTIWIVLMVLFALPASIVYYFVVKRGYVAA